jgi:hypothetical protein
LNIEKPRPLKVTYLDKISFANYWFTWDEWQDVFKNAGFTSVRFITFDDKALQHKDWYASYINNPKEIMFEAFKD